MIQLISIQTFVCLAFSVVCGLVHAQSERDTAVWDLRKRNWIFKVFSPDGGDRFEELTYTPRIYIDPVVGSSISWRRDSFEYRYQLGNGRNARQAISEVSVRAPHWDAAQIVRKAPIPGMTSREIMDNALAFLERQDAFIARVIRAPDGWKPFLNVARPTRTIFGWRVDHRNGGVGVLPGMAQDAFSVLRTELPGAGWMELQGDTPDLFNAVALPGDGAAAERAAEILSNDSLEVAVLVPAIIAPSPHSTSEFARRVKAHVAEWGESGIADVETATTISRQLDELIVAADAKRTGAVVRAATQVMFEAFLRQPGMTHLHTDNDRDGRDSRPMRTLSVTAEGRISVVQAPAVPLQRVAARALVFNMRYLLLRLGTLR